MALSMKWATTAGIAAAAALMLVGCGNKGGTPSGESGNAGGTGLKLGFLVKQPEEKWFQNEWKFAQECADKNHFQLLKIGAVDGEKVLSAIDSLGSNGAKGFVICTPDVKLGPSIVAKAKQYNMKVYSVDDQFVGPDGKFMADVPYMGLSARKIGENVGDALYAEFKKRGWTPADTGAMAITFDELNTVKERTDGATDALKKAGFPADHIYRGATRRMDVPNDMDAASIVLTQHPNVKHWLIYSTNDEGVLGAVRATEQRGLTAKDVCGIGIGGSTAFSEFKKPQPTGFFATVMISARRHGYETTENLYKWVTQGIQPPMDTRTTGVLVNRDNFVQFAQKEGLMDAKGNEL